MALYTVLSRVVLPQPVWAKTLLQLEAETAKQDISKVNFKAVQVNIYDKTNYSQLNIRKREVATTMI